MKSIKIYNELQDYLYNFHGWCEGKTKSEIHKFRDGWGIPNDSMNDGEIDETTEPKYIYFNVKFECRQGIKYSCIITFESDNALLMEYIISPTETNMTIKNYDRLP